MNVIYEKSFLRDLKKVKDRKTLEDLSKILDIIKATHEISSIVNIKKISGHSSAFRIRTGDYRLGFFYENNTVIITRFLHRKDIYKWFP